MSPDYTILEEDHFEIQMPDIQELVAQTVLAGGENPLAMMFWTLQGMASGVTSLRRQMVDLAAEHAPGVQVDKDSASLTVFSLVWSYYVDVMDHLADELGIGEEPS